MLTAFVFSSVFCVAVKLTRMCVRGVVWVCSYRYLLQAINRHKNRYNESGGPPLSRTAFFFILNVEGTDLIYQVQLTHKHADPRFCSDSSVYFLSSD